MLPTSHRKFHSISLHRLAHSFSTATKPLSTSSSLCPNQSASQVSSSPLFIPFPRPDKRPSNLPPEILWTWDNCKKDPYVDVSPSNVSRPPMRCAIRHEDGTILTDGQWKAIRRTVMLVTRTCLQPLILTAQPRATQSRKKMYFKRYFLTEWAAALRELESLAPLLSLCAEEYKADHTLGAVLHDEASRPRPQPEPPASRASTPSSLGPPRPSRIGPPQHGPPRGNPATNIPAPPPPTSPLSSTAHHRPPSPRRVALKSSQKDPKPPPTAGKGKHRREPSPEQGEKRTRNAEDAGALLVLLCCVTLTPSDSRPAFLTMVRSNLASEKVSLFFVFILPSLTLFAAVAPRCGSCRSQVTTSQARQAHPG